ncbi:MAG TPA: ATP-binding cassette domain-containing protein [Burkholderiaceae bacterium]|nr:ATP-binding cassette domain-containing protein [Burkholderiaceae bacterium]
MELTFESMDARHWSARRSDAAALSQVSLRVRHGEQLAVIGPSGAGKTTLLHCASAALRPSRGRVTLDGMDPWALQRRRLTRLRGRLFLAPQVPPLPPRQRVVTSLLAARLPSQGLLASLRSLFYPSDIPAAYVALQRFDLADKLFERVDRLSGGERQRVGLARALLARASLWLIDEPLSALDPVRARQAIDTLVDAARTGGHTLVATLHDVEIALAAFPRIVGLRGGAVAFDLPAAQVSADRLRALYQQPAAPLPEFEPDLPPAAVAASCR